jgi:DNA polymerase
MTSPDQQLAAAYLGYQKLLVMKALDHEGGGRFVPGEGPLNAPLMFVGEAPGLTEDREGRPFCGPSGVLLREGLKTAGIDPACCFITNIVKIRPPHNRTPYIYELQASRPCLVSEILAVRPLVIATLGVPALRALDDRPAALGQRHGRRERWTLPEDGRWDRTPEEAEFSCDLIPLYHPSWILRTGNEDLMLADLKTI